MKVTHIFWSLGFGGIETMLINIANAQAEAGAKVSIIIINDLCEESLVNALRKDVKLCRLNRKLHSKGFGFILKLNRELRCLNPDIIHLHASMFYKMIWNRKYSREACSTLHDLPTGSVRRGGLLADLICKLVGHKQGYSNVVNINRIPKVFAISNAVQEALWRDYHVKSAVVCNGIVTKRFNQRLNQMPSTTFRIVMVSRLEHNKKGQDLLIEAAAQLRSRVSVDFIGAGSSMDYLQSLVQQLHIEEYVHFLGEQTQDYIAAHLFDYDLFVQPSRWEGFGLTVAEAMAAHVPVLVSEGQGPAEVTCGNRYGWLFANGNARALAEQIDYIISHYEEAMDKADKARVYVQNVYDVSITARKYLHEYEMTKIDNNVKI